MGLKDELRKKCRFRISPAFHRRRGNCLCIEAGAFPLDRCTLKPPDHWPDGMVLRWIGSGGDATVLGKCAIWDCPLVKESEEKS